MDIGSVLGEIGIFPEYWEVTGTPPGNLMGLSGPRWKRGEEARAGPRAPPPQSE